MPIRLQFVAERGIGSATIAWFSSGHLSHVDACLFRSIERERLFGARNDRVGGQPAGVWARPPDYALFSRRVIAEIPATPEQEHRFYRFLWSQRGKPYDRLAILAFAVNRNWREPDSWICSELQAHALEAAGVFARPLYLAANKITPVALALAVSALPGVQLSGDL